MARPLYDCALECRFQLQKTFRTLRIPQQSPKWTFYETGTHSASTRFLSEDQTRALLNTRLFTEKLHRISSQLADSIIPIRYPSYRGRKSRRTSCHRPLTGRQFLPLEVLLRVFSPVLERSCRCWPKPSPESGQQATQRCSLDFLGPN